MESRCIAFDFDGTIAHYKGWMGENKFGKIMEGCKEALDKIKEMGYKIIIHTCRKNTLQLKQYLQDNNLPFDAINSNVWNKVDRDITSKLFADIYVDDRNVTFDGNWDEIPDKIFNFHNAKEILEHKEEILKKLRSTNPYSENIFIEPTKEEWDILNKTLNENGMKCLDGYSGSIGRRSWNMCCDKLEELMKGK